MEDSRKKYLEKLKKEDVMTEIGAKWADKFHESSPFGQYKLLNFMQQAVPVKPARSQGEKEELPRDIQKKQMLEVIKKRYMKA